MRKLFQSCLCLKNDQALPKRKLIAVKMCNIFNDASTSYRSENPNIVFISQFTFICCYLSKWVGSSVSKCIWGILQHDLWGLCFFWEICLHFLYGSYDSSDKFKATLCKVRSHLVSLSYKICYHNVTFQGNKGKR